MNWIAAALFFLIGKGVLEMEGETIAAIATAMTNSGIGIIRISGEAAIETADKILRLKGTGKRLMDCPSHTIHYGYAVDGEVVVDEVMALLMKGPRSYTREDTVEIDCHGGIFVMNRILSLLLQNGARPAEPGEFTKRAFLNGRIDLAQAESVIDIINSKNEFSLKASVQQLRGGLSDRIKNMREGILFELAHIESALDDPEHYSLEEHKGVLTARIQKALDELTVLLSDFENGSLLREGIRTVIVGRPNSGKSSLLNALAGKERAIVTDVAGTTRDAIEEWINLDGLTLNLVDTAGIRRATDEVERIGVQIAKEQVKEADLALYVVDGSIPLNEDDFQIMELLRGCKVIVLLNKSDLSQAVHEEEIKSRLNQKVISISAKQKEGLERLKDAALELFFQGSVTWNDEVHLMNARHKALLLEVKNSLIHVRESILQGMPEDFYSIDLMDAYAGLGKMIGEEVEDDLVNEIFSKFCMGK